MLVAAFLEGYAAAAPVAPASSMPQIASASKYHTVDVSVKARNVDESDGESDIEG